MRFRMECLSCGSSVVSPEGRDGGNLEAALELIDAMGVCCRRCGGPVTMRVQSPVDERCTIGLTDLLEVL
jgi:hypothetical protein